MKGRRKSSGPDLDPHDFGPPGSRFVGQRYRSGSGSGFFQHQAKIVRKAFSSIVFRLIFDFLSLKNDVNVPSKRNKQKKLPRKGQGTAH
jgi:hypothetical protein